MLLKIPFQINAVLGSVIKFSANQQPGNDVNENLKSELSFKAWCPTYKMKILVAEINKSALISLGAGKGLLIADWRI